MRKFVLFSVVLLLVLADIISGSSVIQTEDHNENEDLMNLLIALEVAEELQDNENLVQKHVRRPLTNDDYYEWLAEKELEQSLTNAVGIKEPVDDNNDLGRIFGNDMNDGHRVGDNIFDSPPIYQPIQDDTEDGTDWNRIFGNDIAAKLYDSDDLSDYIAEDDDAWLFGDNDSDFDFDDTDYSSGIIGLPLQIESANNFLPSKDLEGSGEEPLNNQNLDDFKQLQDIFADFEKNDNDGVMDEDIEFTINMKSHKKFFNKAGALNVF